MFMREYIECNGYVYGYFAIFVQCLFKGAKSKIYELSPTVTPTLRLTLQNTTKGVTNLKPREIFAFVRNCAIELILYMYINTYREKAVMRRGNEIMFEIFFMRLFYILLVRLFEHSCIIYDKISGICFFNLRIL